MVFIVYNPQNNFMTGVYEDEKDAYYAIEFLDETEYKSSFKVIELQYFKKQKYNYKNYYSEEDNDIDEEYYDKYNILLFIIIIICILFKPVNTRYSTKRFKPIEPTY